MRRRSHLALIAVVLIAGCKPTDNTTTKGSEPVAAADPAAIQAAIDSANARFLAALASGDTASATLNYTDDAVVMMPGDEAWTGSNLHQKMVEFMKSYKVQNAKLGSSTPLLLAGDYAIETGTFEWTLVPPKGKSTQEKGKYLTVWTKQADGTWKILRDINNTNM